MCYDKTTKKRSSNLASLFGHMSMVIAQFVLNWKIDIRMIFFIWFHMTSV